MAKTEETLIIEDVLYQNLFGSNPCLAREICRVHDSIYASDENDILIGRKMKSVIDKLF